MRTAWLQHLILALAILSPVLCPKALAAPQTIRPGAVWPDDRGEHVQAHGGGILKVGETYYWFGEDRAKEVDPRQPCVACYASEDLVHWRFKGVVLRLSDLDPVGARCVLERPKVFHNPRTGRFVMYLHVDGPVPGGKNNYGMARVGVAVSDSVDGHYRFVGDFRPLGLESRDIGQFVDDDGSAYLIFESRPAGGFYVAKLSDDYLSPEKIVCFIQAPLEGGAIVHFDGLYYVIGSQLTGWKPNPNVYATARSLAGPWTEFKDVAPPEKNTYGSQSTFLLKITGTKTTTVVFLGDIWRPKTQWDSRYLWMPLEIGGGRLRLPAPVPWTLDVKTGETALLEKGAGE